MNAPISVRVQHLLPQRLLCAFIYRISRSRIGWLKSALIGWFARHYAIDLEEAEIQSLAEYPSFNAFFTRALRPGARRIDAREDAIVSPADGRLTQAETVTAGRLLQAKGFDYALAELLGASPQAVAGFEGGLAVTIYLAPHNYHRVHTPLAGELTEMRYIAGQRYGVNAATASWIDGLYCRNERLVCWFEAPFGRYALVLVGALNVSSISTSLTGEIRSGADRHWPDLEDARFARGEEFARFNLGSTVVLVLPRACARLEPSVHAGMSVRVGQRIGTIAAPQAERTA